MNIGKYKQIFSNLNYKTVFFPVFVAMLSCFYMFKDISFTLHTFDRGIVSAATLEMLDINQRVALFWHAVWLGVFSFLFLLIIQNFLLIRYKAIHQHVSFINIISFLGCIVVIHSFLSVKQSFTLEFICHVIGFVCVSAILSIFWEKKFLLENKHFLLFHFWYIITGFLIYFIITNFNLYLTGKTFRIIFVFPFEIALLTMLCVQVLSYYKIIRLEALLKYTFPLLLFVLWNFVSNELNYILNQHSIFANPLLLFICGYIVILLFYLSKWKIQHNKPTKPANTQLWHYYFPILLTIIACYAYYIPVIPAINEFFETANPANSILLSCKYGKLPFFEYLNSHALSETFFGFIYVLLNGFNGSLDFFIYDFLYLVIFVLITYYFLWKLTNNAYFAFAISLLLPFQEVIFCDTFSCSLISIFILSRIYYKPSYKNYILGFVWSFFLIMWRIDTGYANILAFILTSVIVMILHNNRKYFIQFCMSFIAVVLSFALIAIVIILIKKIDIFVVVKQAMHYLSGNQAHGALSVYNDPNRLFVMHYIVFPAVILFSSLFIVLQLKRFIKKNVFVILSILFLSVFYLCNIPRGIVRHGFNEWADTHLSTFAYLIIGLLLFFIVSQKYLKTKNLIFVVGLYFLVVAFKFPDIKDYSSVFEKFNIAFKDFKPLNTTSEKIKRYKEEPAFASENYLKLKHFMDAFFEKEATFIDFSNTPMLYFYTQRIVPSYFSQYMQNTIDDYLQYQNIRDLKKYDIPVVVFSNVPNNWHDATDGVPNVLRYNKIAEYIYTNYYPLKTIGKHAIWLKHDIVLHCKGADYSLLTHPDLLDLKKLPFIEANYTNKPYLGDLLYQWNTNQIKNNTFKSPFTIDRSNGGYLVLNFERKDTTSQKCLIILSNDSIQHGSFSFDLLNKSDKEKYAIHLSTHYSWYSKLINSFAIRFENELAAPSIQSIQLHKANKSENK